MNDIRHLNIVLHNSEYHFSDTELRLQLDSLLDVDLRNHCKNCKIKEIIDKVGKATDTEKQIAEARLTCWISEVCKLAEECVHDTKCYLEAAEDVQRAAKRQALSHPSHNTNNNMSTKDHPSSSSSASTTSL